MSLVEGEVFSDRYRIIRCIAAGGMGAVYEAIHLETQRRRALKVMLPHILHSADLRRRFTQEARIAAQIESEFIVDVFDAGIDASTQIPFLAMELLHGEELGARVRRLGRLPPEEVILYLYQTALALDKTHRAAIIHRDLKPENLFLTEREDGPPRIKVLDFGVAKLIAAGATSGGVTRSVGTPLYMAPEQFRGDTTISAASDIYSFGMVAYTLLVGAPYWADEACLNNAYAFMVAAARGPSERAVTCARRQGVALPALFDEWFATATAVDPASRFVTATVAVKTLAEVFEVPLLAQLSLSRCAPQLHMTGGVPPGMAVTTVAVQRRARASVGAIVLALALAALAGGLYVLHVRERADAPGSDHEKAAPSAVVSAPAVVSALAAPLAPAPQAPPAALATLDPVKAAPTVSSAEQRLNETRPESPPPAPALRVKPRQRYSRE